MLPTGRTSPTPAIQLSAPEYERAAMWPPARLEPVVPPAAMIDAPLSVTLPFAETLTLPPIWSLFDPVAANALPLAVTLPATEMTLMLPASPLSPGLDVTAKSVRARAGDDDVFRGEEVDAVRRGILRRRIAADTSEVKRAGAVELAAVDGDARSAPHGDALVGVLPAKRGDQAVDLDVTAFQRDAAAAGDVAALRGDDRGPVHDQTRLVVRQRLDRDRAAHHL